MSVDIAIHYLLRGQRPQLLLRMVSACPEQARPLLPARKAQATQRSLRAHKDLERATEFDPATFSLGS